MGRNSKEISYGEVEGTDADRDQRSIDQTPGLGRVAFDDVKPGDRMSVRFVVDPYAVSVHRGLIHLIRIYGNGELIAYVVNTISSEGPLIIAHRGASGYAPENTLSSIYKAMELGANAMEIDVHTTRDGEIILMHDSDVSRTTTGSGHVSSLNKEGPTRCRIMVRLGLFWREGPNAGRSPGGRQGTGNALHRDRAGDTIGDRGEDTES